MIMQMMGQREKQTAGNANILNSMIAGKHTQAQTDQITNPRMVNFPGIGMIPADKVIEATNAMTDKSQGDTRNQISVLSIMATRAIGEKNAETSRLRQAADAELNPARKAELMARADKANQELKQMQDQQAALQKLIDGGKADPYTLTQAGMEPGVKSDIDYKDAMTREADARTKRLEEGTLTQKEKDTRLGDYWASLGSIEDTKYAEGIGYAGTIIEWAPESSTKGIYSKHDPIGTTSRAWKVFDLPRVPYEDPKTGKEVKRQLTMGAVRATARDRGISVQQYLDEVYNGKY